MPIALALVIRKIIALGITLTIYTTAEAFIKAALGALPPILEKAFGISQEESKDFIHDFMIDQALAFGLTLLAFQKNMPIKVAETLGFTTKGWSKIGFSKTMTAKLEGKLAGKIPVDLTKGTGYWKILGKFMGIITAVFMATQSIEVFAYKPQFFTNILNFFGLGPLSRKILIPPRKPLFSETEIKQYANSSNVSEDTMKGYLEAAEDVIIAQLKIPTQSNVLTVVRNDLLTEKTETGEIITGTARQPITPIKVFTGIVSQGTLGAPAEFTPRENDLIESVDELKDSAQNNLAPFITALPGKIIYEIKIVSSVTTKDGFRRTGEAQKVLSKYTAAGVPLYRTVVNKFAVLDIFIMTDKLSKAKISSIVLGPTDAVKLQPKTNELKNIETSIKQDLFTSNISDITGIQTAQPITITAPPIQPAETIIAPAPIISTPQKIQLDDSFFNSRDTFFGEIYRIKNDMLLIYEPAKDQLTETEKIQAGNFGAQSARAVEKLKAKGIDFTALRREPFISDILHKYIDRRKNVGLEEFLGGAIAAPTPVSAKPASSTCLLQTLYEWYSAQGQSLPSVGLRSTLYEQLGLGLAAYYTGTGEQNTKLLASLKRNNGCQI